MCRFELLCRIRIARGFGTVAGRRQLVKQRLLAFNVLLQCSPSAGECRVLGLYNSTHYNSTQHNSTQRQPLQCADVDCIIGGSAAGSKGLLHTYCVMLASTS